MKKSSLCCVKFCRNRRRKNARICNKHASARFKELHPIKYRYNIAKQSAKSRGIEWNLSYEEFEKFCTETGYLRNSGKTRDKLTIDRIDPTQGYHYRNLRAIPHFMNSKLGAIYGAYLGMIERRRCKC